MNHDIEATLGSLVPSRSRINRDQIFYQAGQASVRTSPVGRGAWMALAGLLGLIAIGEGGLLAFRPSTRVVERIVVVREPAAPTIQTDRVRVSSEAPALIAPDRLAGLEATAHGRLVDQVFRYGLDGLPRSVALGLGQTEPRPPSSRQRLQEEMRHDLFSGDPS